MKRRDFLTLLGGAAASALPSVARAQQPAIPKLGFLHVGSPGAFGPYVTVFRRGLKEAGIEEDRDVAIDYLWAEGHQDRLKGLAANLVQRRVAAVIAIASDAALAARHASTTIPIVFLIADDPVGIGLAASFNRPGGNATGVTLFSLATAAKRMELLHELVPGNTPIAVLLNAGRAMSKVELKEAQTAGQKLGRPIHAVSINSERAIDTAFASIVESRAGALLVTTDPLLTNQRSHIAALAARHKIPASYPFRAFAAAGGLLSYGASLRDSYQELGAYIARILKGEKPADLPIQQPTRFELVINLKTAKALGLTIPPMLIARADEVIE